jgi:hypothetical protein
MKNAGFHIMRNFVRILKQSWEDKIKIEKTCEKLRVLSSCLTAIFVISAVTWLVGYLTLFKYLT